MKYDMTIIAVALHPPGVNPVYGEGVIHLELADESSGYYLKVSQITDDGEQTLRLDPEELVALNTVARQMVAQKSEVAYV